MEHSGDSGGECVSNASAYLGYPGLKRRKTVVAVSLYYEELV